MKLIPGNQMHNVRHLHYIECCFLGTAFLLHMSWYWADIEGWNFQGDFITRLFFTYLKWPEQFRAGQTSLSLFPHGLPMWLAWAFTQHDGLTVSHMLPPQHQGGHYQAFLMLIRKSPRMYFLLILLVLVVTRWLRFKRRWNRLHLLIRQHQGNIAKKHMEWGLLHHFRTRRPPNSLR